jgi:hypothetical protein
VREGEATAPIFNFTDDDLITFSSIEAMKTWIEPWDVQDADRCFDAEGRRITLRGVGVRRTRWTVGGGETVFDPQHSGELATAEFDSRLREYLVRVGSARFGLTESDVESLPLARLIAVVAPATLAM